MKQLILILILFVFSNVEAQNKNQREWYDYPFEERYQPLTLNINAVVLHRKDGTGNFDLSDPEQKELLMDYLENINYIYSHFKYPKDTTNCYNGTDFISDARLRFKFHLIDVRSDYYWNYLNSGSVPEERRFAGFSPSEHWYLKSLDDSISALPTPKGINIYFTSNGARFDQLAKRKGADYNVSTNMAGQHPDTRNLKRSSQVHAPNVYLRYLFQRYQATRQYDKPWSVTKHWWMNAGLAHELGHDLGLFHSNEYYRTNQCKYSLMSQKGTDPRNWLPPTEIKRMHWNLTHTNLMQFVTPESAYNATWVLNQDTEWDKPRRFYHNFELSKGVTLTISNKIILPPQSFIKLNRNSKIILKKGAQIVDAFGKEYRNFILSKSSAIIYQ